MSFLADGDARDDLAEKRFDKRVRDAGGTPLHAEGKRGFLFGFQGKSDDEVFDSFAVMLGLDPEEMRRIAKAEGWYDIEYEQPPDVDDDERLLDPDDPKVYENQVEVGREIAKERLKRYGPTPRLNRPSPMIPNEERR